MRTTRPLLQNQTAKPTFMDVYPYAAYFAGMEARKLVRGGVIAGHEREDARQELLLHVWEQLPRYDSNRGPVHGYLNVIIRNRTASLVTERKALKRGAQFHYCSLHDPVSNDSTKAVLDVLRAGNFSQCPAGAVPSIHAFDLRIAVDRIIAGLPPRLARIGELLRERSAAETALILRISPKTLYRYIQEIRVAFAACNPQSSTRPTSRVGGVNGWGPRPKAS